MDRDWNVEKSKLKQKFALLTDHDLLLGEGNHEEVLERLQVRIVRWNEEL